MWYKCEVIRQFNQVHQLKLLLKITLMKNSQFCEDMSKSKKCKSCNINHIPLTKMSHFSEFLVELCKTLERMGKRDQNIDSYEEFFFFFVKYTVFIKNKNEVLTNSDFCYTWSNDIFNECSKFQNYLINILGDMTS